MIIVPEAIAALFQKLAECAWHGYDATGADIQEWLTEAGVLKEETIDAPCCPGCVCAGVDAPFPTICYRKNWAVKSGRKKMPR